MEESLHSRWASFLNLFQQYLLYAIVASLPLQLLAVIPGTSLTITKVFGLLLIAAVALECALRGRIVLPRTHLESGWFFFLVACAISAAYSAHPEDAKIALFTLLTYGVVFYAVTAVAVRQHVQPWVPGVYVLSAAASALGAILASLGLFFEPSVDRLVPGSNIRRFAFGMPDANEQGMLYLFAFCFLLFLPQMWRSRRRCVFSITAVGFLSYALVLTMSRTAWACLAAMVFVRCIMTRRRWLLLSGAVVLAIVGVAVLAVMHPNAASLAQRRVAETFKKGDLSIASRVAHYAAVSTQASGVGAVGYGLGETLKNRVLFRNPLGEPISTTVHSVPLIMLLDSGWFGFFAYGWLCSCIAGLAFWAIRLASSPSKPLVTAYTLVLMNYGLVSLAMPFLYRSALPVMLGCAVGVMLTSLPAVDSSACGRKGG